MDIKILKNSGDEMRLELNNLTIAEILRVYLNKNPKVTFAVWKREHPTKNPVLLVKTKGKTAKKAIKNAISNIIKELDKVKTEFKSFKF